MLTRAISLPVNCKFIYAINYCLGGLNKALTCGVKDALLGPWVYGITNSYSFKLFLCDVFE